jgi:hypothetical protein
LSQPCEHKLHRTLYGSEAECPICVPGAYLDIPPDSWIELIAQTDDDLLLERGIKLGSMDIVTALARTRGNNMRLLARKYLRLLAQVENGAENSARPDEDGE